MRDTWPELVIEERFHTLAVARQLLLVAARQRTHDPAATIATAGLVLDLTHHLEAGSPRATVEELRVRAWCETAATRQLSENFEAAELALGYAARYLGADLVSPARAVYSRALGQLRAEQGKVDEALALLERGAQLFAELGGFGEERGEALADKGRLLLEAGEPEKAAEALGEAILVLARETEAPQLQAKARHTLALCHAELGRGQLAMETMASARRFFSGEPVDLLRLTWLEARIAWRCGERHKAEEQLQEVFQGFLRAGLQFEAALTCLDLATLYAAAGEQEKIWQLEKAAIPLCRAGHLAERARAVLQFALLMVTMPGRSRSAPPMPRPSRRAEVGAPPRSTAAPSPQAHRSPGRRARGALWGVDPTATLAQDESGEKIDGRVRSASG